MPHPFFSKLLLCVVIVLSAARVHAQPPPDSASGHKKMKENKCLVVDTAKDIVSADRVNPQYAPSMENRTEGRFLPIIAAFLITEGVTEAEKLIDDRKNRYISQDSYVVDNQYFYDQISAKSAYDPVGINFKGFRIIRINEKSRNEHDTVFMAKFILDTSGNKIEEIMNNGIFKLKLDSLHVTSTKVKVPKSHGKLNMDFEVDFTSTYRGDNGQIYADLPLGKFTYSIRNAPIDPEDSTYGPYYARLTRQKPSLNGQCFTIPRSTGYYKNPDTKAIEPCWGPGLYSIKVNVKETSKEKFVDKIIVLAATPVISQGASSLQGKMNPTPTKGGGGAGGKPASSGGSSGGGKPASSGGSAPPTNN